MKRRHFLKLLSASLGSLVVPTKTFFLPPSGGWALPNEVEFTVRHLVPSEDSVFFCGISVPIYTYAEASAAEAILNFHYEDYQEEMSDEWADR